MVTLMQHNTAGRSAALDLLVTGAGTALLLASLAFDWVHVLSILGSLGG